MLTGVVDQRGEQRLSREHAALMLDNFRDNFMALRKDWNRAGPRIPAWFRARLRRIDPKLVLQFIPPFSEENPGGPDKMMFPYGAVALCRRLRNTGMLHKRWTLALADELGRYQVPTNGLVKLLIHARNLYRKGAVHKLEQYYDASVAAILKGKKDDTYDEILCGVAETMRATGMTSRFKPTVFFPSRG